MTNASWMPSSTSPAVGMVRASLETGAKIGGWSSSCRVPVPQRSCGARPPTTTIGEPANCAWATALTPLVTPGPGGEHGEPGDPGQLAGRLGGEGRGLLVAHVEQPRSASVGLDRAVVHREDVRAESVNIVSTPWARATATASSPAWPVRSASVLSGMPAGYSRRSGRGTAWFVRLQRVHDHEQQVGAHLRRPGAERRAGGRARAGTPRRCRRRGRGRGRRTSSGCRPPAAIRAIQGSRTRSGTTLRRSTAIVANASRSGSPLLKSRSTGSSSRSAITSSSTVSSGVARCGEPGQDRRARRRRGRRRAPSPCRARSRAGPARAAARSSSRSPHSRILPPGSSGRLVVAGDALGEHQRREAAPEDRVGVALAEPDAQPGGHAVAEAGEQVVVDARGRSRSSASGRRCRRAAPGRGRPASG